ncbi:MAG: UDP-N-acetylmuramoyl-L-alanine--D-glutamate ligase [Actinomycetota bacterium]
MSAFDGRRAVVIGAGVAGRAAAATLAAEGATVLVTERRDAGAVGDISALGSAGVDVRTGGHMPADLDGAEIVVVSPGVPPDAPPLVWARERGIAVWGELELGARLARVPYLAVTGTNGKTTTTGMLAACLRAGGIDAVACGNIGFPFTTAVREQHQALVVEVSSFQLAIHERFHPRVSVLVNLAPDHLDHHGTFEAYRDAKAAIYRNQRDDDVHVGNRDDPTAAAVSATAPCAHVWFGAGVPTADGPDVGFDGDTLLARGSDGAVELGSIDGERAGHRVDAAAAAAAALAYGVTPDAVRDGLVSFEPAAHRGELVAEVDGVRFLDNSKATNVHAAAAAIAAVRDAVLIAGGRTKGQDLSPLRDTAGNLRAVVAIGEAAPSLHAVYGDLVPVHDAGSIEDAVGAAFAASARPGIVLLAPACASWDQFASYAERGDRFATAARALVAGVHAGG